MMMLLDRRLREGGGGWGESRGEAEDGEVVSGDKRAAATGEGPGERRRRRETGEVEGDPRALA